MDDNFKLIVINESYFRLFKDQLKVSSVVQRIIKEEFKKNFYKSDNELKFLLIFSYSNHGLLIEKLKKKLSLKALLPMEKYSVDSEEKEFKLVAVKIEHSSLGIPPSRMKRRLKNGERGLTLLEGLWLALFIPDVLKFQALDLLNSIYSKECIPTIYEWEGERFMSAVCPDVSDMMCGAPIVTGEIPLDRSDFSNADILMGKIRSLHNANFKRI